MKSMNYNYNGNTIKFFYQDSEQEVISIHLFMKVLDEIKLNIEKFVGKDLLKNIVFEFYSSKLPDVNSYMSFGNNQVAVGLATYFSKTNKSIKIGCFTSNVSYNDLPKWYSDILSHEIGHLFEKELQWDIKNDIRKEYDKIRGYTSQFENIYEVFAEDFRVLFGATLAQYHRRSNYKSASNELFLKDLLIIYKDLNEWLMNNNAKILRWDYTSTNLNGCMIGLYNVVDVFKLFPTYIYFNKFGIYLYENGLWKSIKSYL